MVHPIIEKIILYNSIFHFLKKLCLGKDDNGSKGHKNGHKWCSLAN
jgi:hypothetical protein